MKPKYLSGYILIVFCLLTACEKKRDKYLVGVSQCSVDEWRDKMNMEMLNEAAISQKIDLIILSSNDDTENQISDIKYLVEQGIDLLILTPNEISSITPVVEKIYDSGIPVILVDRKIRSDKYTAFIAADNYQIGAEVGNYAANLLNGKGNIAEIKGLAGSSSAIERHRGFFDIIKNYPEINIVFEGDAGWLKDEGAIEMRKALEIEEPIDLVFAHNDRMAKGAYQEAENAGRTDEMYFIGIDGLPGLDEGIDMVLQNKLIATFFYPTGGERTIQLACDILENKSFERENILATSVVDKTNAGILKLQTDQIVEQQSKIVVLNQRIIKQLEKHTVQRKIMYLISFLAFLLCALLIGLLRAYNAKNKLNTKLQSSYTEINKQKEELENNQQQLSSLSKQLEEATLNKLDEEFILKFRNYVLERISDSTLNVENISKEFGLSRAQFYRKIKAITNQGPNEFIRAIRLNKAMEILKTGKNVSEAAYEVGFTSPSYFTKCFKEFFLKSPSRVS